MSKKDVLEKRAKLIIKYRNLKISKKEDAGDIVTYYLTNDDRKYVMQCINNQNNIGIAFVRDLNIIVNEKDADQGIIITDSKYTYSARSNAPRLNVELIPPTIPSFDIFKHKLVPNAEILSKDEKKKIIEKYHAEPYQFPFMNTKDPVSVILGAKRGDIVRFISESITAGTTTSYRYVS